MDELKKYLADKRARHMIDSIAYLTDALEQIYDNCLANASPTCRHDMALKFIGCIALDALMKVNRAPADRDGQS